VAERQKSRRPGFVRSAYRDVARLLSIRPRPPWALLFRVARWWTRVVLRESAPQLAAAGLIVCALLFLLGATHAAVGIGALIAVTLLIVAEARHAWLAHRSTPAIDEALEGIERGEAPRVPRSHLVVPPLAFVTRGV
jgi:hypothetical protein